MDVLELEAMLIRHRAAVNLLDAGNGVELLSYIIAPSEAVLDASMEVAEEKGPSEMALRLSRMKDEPTPKPVSPSRARKERDNLPLLPRPIVWAKR